MVPSQTNSSVAFKFVKSPVDETLSNFIPIVVDLTTSFAIITDTLATLSDHVDMLFSHQLPTTGPPTIYARGAERYPEPGLVTIT